MAQVSAISRPHQFGRDIAVRRHSSSRQQFRNTAVETRNASRRGRTRNAGLRAVPVRKTAAWAAAVLRED